jgi:hypothetical protein
VRNLLQYPVTREEVKDALQRALDAHGGCVGGVQPMILHDILSKVDDDRWYESTFGEHYVKS